MVLVHAITILSYITNSIARGVYINTFFLHALDILYLLLQDGYTTLMLAANSGSNELVHILLQAGADVNVQDKVSDMYINIMLLGM